MLTSQPGFLILELILIIIWIHSNILNLEFIGVGRLICVITLSVLIQLLIALDLLVSSCLEGAIWTVARWEVIRVLLLLATISIPGIGRIASVIMLVHIFIYLL